MAHNPKISAVARLVRRHDHDRFMTALFAPRARREALLALYAFNYEVARIRETVTEPILGSIRLQWWREAIQEINEGKPPRKHEVVEALAASFGRHHLPGTVIVRLLDARERDMLADPPQTLAALEDYAAATGGSLSLIALTALDAVEWADDGKIETQAETAARHAGTAYALAGLLRAAAFHARSGRNFIPAELDPKRSVLNLKPTPELAEAARTIAGAARSHLEKARALKDKVPRQGIAALLPAVLAENWLKRLDAAQYDLFDPRLAAPDPWRSLRLWRAARAGRF